MRQFYSLSAWIKASRLASQSYIFFPILLGQACCYYQWRQIDWTLFVCLHLFGLFDQLYIVYANDYADQDADRCNTTFNLFSGGSRVLVDGDLTPGQLKNGAIVMAGLCIAIGVGLTLFYQRWWAVPVVIFALSLVWAYSYPPIKLSYRGGGETLQMIGVGLVLPLFSYYVQAGSLVQFPWLLIAALLPSQLACAMSTSLPDEPSDRSAAKRTSTVVLGAKVVKVLILTLNLLTILLVLLFSGFGPGSDYSIKIVAVPLIAATGHLAFIRGEPGTFRLAGFNFFSVLTVLSLQGGLAIAFFSI